MVMSERAERAAGSAVGSCLEGSRTLLVEVQALVAPAAQPAGPDPKAELANAKLELEAIESERSDEFAELKKEALLANPLLDFDKLLMVRSRKGNRFSANWQTRVDCGAAGAYDDELVVMSPIHEGEIKTVYRPSGGKFVGDGIHAQDTLDGGAALTGILGRTGHRKLGRLFEIRILHDDQRCVAAQLQHRAAIAGVLGDVLAHGHPAGEGDQLDVPVCDHLVADDSSRTAAHVRPRTQAPCRRDRDAQRDQRSGHRR